jgi:hypothetical protein
VFVEGGNPARFVSARKLPGAGGKNLVEWLEEAAVMDEDGNVVDDGRRGWVYNVYRAAGTRARGGSRGTSGTSRRDSTT